MREIPAIKVHQWLPEWNHVKVDEADDPWNSSNSPAIFLRIFNARR